MTLTAQPLIDDYIRRLHRAARALPRDQGEELVAEIRDHLAAALPPNASEAEVRNVLDGLGSPEAIVAAAEPDRPATRRGAREVFALLLLVTGFPPIIGWLVGAGLLLSSPLWSARQKLLGILVWPGGYLVFGLIASFRLLSVSTSQSCSDVTNGHNVVTQCANSGSSSWPVAFAIVVFFVAPLGVMAYLYRAAGRQSGG